MKPGFEKYIPFQQIKLENRQWPNNVISKAPIWCSVDLRDGNQALVDPMNMEEKLEFFHTLVDMGFKEIEIGFPSASETEYEICRELIEGNHIPDDVTIQVLVQAREHLIRKTFEAVKGAKNVIIHFYNSTSTLQRKVVFKTDMEGVTKIAIEGAKLIKQLTDEYTGDTNFRFEYSPESFSGTEVENAVYICDKVMEALGSTKENPVILNLPNTVEMCTPNTYADQVEYFIKHIKDREACIISLHPHNDRGTGVASGELALLAGAERVEGTIFGNGERTGNLDIVTMGLNMFTQGVDPKLDFSNLPKLREIYERCTDMKINPRQPYIGELVFTAFSGSHQDAINKGMQYMKDSGTEYWEIPYLPIDPADVGREYEPIIRINSQSGKGGAAFVMSHNFGYDLPKKMHPEFSKLVQAKCEELGRELIPKELFEVFSENYLETKQKYALTKRKIYEESENGKDYVHFKGKMTIDGTDEVVLSGVGNGPIDAFFNAIKLVGLDKYEFISYSQHAISQGSDSKAVSYIELKKPDRKNIFGIGIDSNVNVASVLGVLNAINRAEM
ncbi:2-isopropylmalate synthase [Eubacterium sp. OM08-24]|uniref:2-isopropylmalate synthase n=1 Tax=Eubacterium sp. OM08-24 TaxID=2292352 RepID=UPI000E436CC6|nr:2-isopropylmalate synthase [Eubacterium sp. OM08-24]RGM18007.1 2-isopropylmalate synthase [Eubacterium sp. OM08-24]